MQSAPKQTTQTTTTEPSKIASPYIEKYYAQLDDAYSNGKPGYYPGSTVIDLSDATKNAQNSIINTATNGSPLIGNAHNAVNNVTTGAAFDPTGANTLKAGTGFTNTATGNAQSLSDILTGQSNPATAMLQGTANGDYLNSNPHLAQAIKNANDPLIDQFKSEIAPGINSQFAKAGRSGSGAFASVRNKAEKTLTDAMAKNASDIAYGNYVTERGNMLDAQKSIGGLYDSNAQNAISATGMLGNLSQGQQDSRNNAASALMSGQNAQANTQLAGAGMAGDQRNLDYLDAEKLAGVGAQQDAYKDLQLQDKINRWDASEYKDINNAMQAINAYTTGGFNTQSTTKPYFSNGTSTAIGGIGALASLLALCDRRKKENIKRCGSMIDGTALYEFTYINDPTKQIYIGPMAQDVEITRPHAVIEIDGVKHVHLGALAGDPVYVQ
ncbi:hypothetical protein AS026_15800 [Rhizobium altiplani]|uniref:Peptidase S74 domain-containing protein n=1 Tax=Rhizobium altiplani TaxID=1864509 RepID=A0A109JB33_9HYPH|nr:tail fiber domain-containing protein [Rhizobium altiplani]KWV45668.1 hypothetical protein AS026_15800 [Rhizobium altiplani]